MIHAYRLAVAAALVVIAIPFMVDQVRTAIYPDLEIQRTLTFPLSSGSPVPVTESSIVANEAPKAFDLATQAPVLAPVPEQLQGRRRERRDMRAAGGAGMAVGENGIGFGAAASLGGSVAVSKYSYAAIDPNAIITTGRACRDGNGGR